ncbi:MAG: 4-hydroxy-tetrahydrodipicolinate reductase [Myxococcota bacterium]
MASEVRLGVLGAAGRLGSRVVQLSTGWTSGRVTLATVRPGSALVGQAVPGGPAGLGYSGDGVDWSGCDVILDVSLGAAATAHAKEAARQGKPLLMAATGLDDTARSALQEASQRVAVCVAPNLSAGVWVLAHLVRQAAATLREYDVEVVETHHRHKKDAPSGTALLLAGAAAEGRGVQLKDVMVPSRASVHGARETGSIGMASLRGGDVVGDHTVALYGDGERLELTHRAHSRDTFARGALILAARLAGRGPGMVTVPQLLGLGAA